MVITDNAREGFTLEKIKQLFRLFIPKYTNTLARLEEFSDFDFKKINKITGLNIKGIILDVDDCIAPNRGNILKKNLDHLKKLHEEDLKIVIYSNMKMTNRYEQIEKFIPILVNLPAKPEAAGFEIAYKTLGLKKENVLMIGDNYITDAGCLRLGIPFVKISPITKQNNSLTEKIYNLIKGFYTFISQLHDFVLRRKPIETKDLKG